MSDAFLSSIKNRRTIYALDKQLPISQEKVVELVKEAVSHSLPRSTRRPRGWSCCSAPSTSSSGTSPRTS
ncbi:nitroreductase [Pseudomonas aeruginosa]|nr:nitroreductase [Pseudomonas aeruginosa]